MGRLDHSGRDRQDVFEDPRPLEDWGDALCNDTNSAAVAVSLMTLKRRPGLERSEGATAYARVRINRWKIYRASTFTYTACIRLRGPLCPESRPRQVERDWRGATGER